MGKPENFGFVTPVTENRPLPVLKMFDMGLAWVLEGPTTDATAREVYSIPKAGTEIYMAPEVWDGRAGPPSDIWSAGLISYLLLSMQLPFGLLQSRDRRRTVEESKLAFTSRWTNISPSAMKLVTSMLDKEAYRRTTTASVLADPWLRQPGTAEGADDCCPLQTK